MQGIHHRVDCEQPHVRQGLGFSQEQDDLSLTEERALKALKKTLDFLPQPARQAIFDKVPAPYDVTGIFAGETEEVHKHTVEKSYEQYLVPIEGQADILITGVPYISPYNVHAFLNPLLVSVMVQGYLFNLYRGAPVVRKGGTVIAFHPCTDKFDRDQHPAYVEFFHKLLSKTRDAEVLHKEYENQFRQNPAYVQLYRSGTAYHPLIPSSCGTGARTAVSTWAGHHRGSRQRVRAQILGYETAPTFQEALRMAKETAPRSRTSLACMCRRFSCAMSHRMRS